MYIQGFLETTKDIGSAVDHNFRTLPPTNPNFAVFGTRWRITQK